MNTRSKTDMLNDLYKKYELHKSDTFKSPQGWTIITRSGIDKIQAVANIDIEYEMVEYTHKRRYCELSYKYRALGER